MLLVFLLASNPSTANCQPLTSNSQLSTANSQLSIINCQSQLSTINCQLSTAIRDSVIFRERTIHDTVYITKEVYRDKQLATVNSQLSTISDTIHIVEYRDRVIEHPPKRYVPKFYKCCTMIFWILIAGIVIYVILRLKYSAFNL